MKDRQRNSKRYEIMRKTSDDKIDVYQLTAAD